MNITKDIEQTLRERCYQEAKELYGEKLPQIVEKRLEKELLGISNLYYSELFLLAQMLVKQSNEKGYSTGVRGAIAASLVAFLLGITEINPLCAHYICPICKHVEFFEYCEYGCGIDMPNKQCPDCSAEMKSDGFDIPDETFFGFDNNEIPYIGLNFVSEYYCYLYQKHEELLSKNFVCKEIQGDKHQKVSIYTVHTAERKLDVLQQDTLDFITLLERITGVNAKEIPWNDKGTIRCFTDVKTLGICEFGTRFMRDLLYSTKPKTFFELMKVSGLAHGTDAWYNNADKLIKNGTANLHEVIAFGDDIMLFLMRYGMDRKLAFQIEHAVRKGTFAQGANIEYISAMRKCGIPDWYIDSYKKNSYLFPKAHIAAYTLMALRSAYFKTYYPVQFYAAYLKVFKNAEAVDRLTCGKNTIKKEIDVCKRENEQYLNGDFESPWHNYGDLELYIEIYERGLEGEVLQLMTELYMDV